MGIVIRFPIKICPRSDEERLLPMNTPLIEVWLVLRREVEGNERLYHIQGIGTDEEIAKAMCLNESYMIGPIPLNLALPEEIIEWKGAYFPHAIGTAQPTILTK